MRKQIKLKSPAFILGSFLTCLLGVTLFFISQETHQQRAVLKNIDAQITAEKERQMILEAEWSYLNRPGRIKNMVERVRKSQEPDQKKSDVKILAAMSDIKVPPVPMKKPNKGFSSQKIAMMER